MLVKAMTIGLIPFLLVAIPCLPGQQELTLEEYIRQLESIRQERADAMGPILFDVKNQLESTFIVTDYGELTRGFIAAWVSVVEDGINDLKDLKPVAETQASHEALIGFERELIDAGNLFLREADSLSSGLRVQLSRFLSTGVSSPQSEAACLEIQGVTERNGIQADLLC